MSDPLTKTTPDFTNNAGHILRDLPVMINLRDYELAVGKIREALQTSFVLGLQEGKARANGQT